jgi:putative flippase GtrA
MLALAQQFSRFFGVGVVAAMVHYATLIGLVELAGVAPVPATLAGYVAGGIVSYGLNRRHTYETERSHFAAGWRFALVAGVGFLFTWGLMHAFVERFGWPYLPAQILTTGVVLLWSFSAHKLFTFGERFGGV